MTPERDQNQKRKRWMPVAIVSVLLLAFLCISYSESSGKSLVIDEAPHIASGLAYVEKGVFYGNPQHPPLLKELSGLSMLIGGLRLPSSLEARIFLQGTMQTTQPEWTVGRQLLMTNGSDRVLFWARLPFPLIACLLGLVLYAWGRRILGETAAVGAVFLFVLDPTVMGHSFLVTTDVGVASFTLLFLFALWEYLQNPNWKRLTVCGVALGAVLCTKFSAVLLLPVAAALVFAAFAWRKDRVSGAARAENPPKPAAKVGRNEPCPCGSGKKFKACHGAAAATTALAPAPQPAEGPMRTAVLFLAICAIAYLTVQAIYFFPGDPLVYLQGLRLVNADHLAVYLTTLAGHMANRFTSYFAVAYLLKEPLANLVLAAIGLVVLVRTQAVSRLGKAFLLLTPAVMFLGATIWAANVGIRYIIPVLPFAHLLGGLGIATLLGAAAKWARVAAIALCGWAVVASAGIYPDHLSYFNESACLLTSPGKIGLDGGSQCATSWLDESNVDWGQGLKQLKRWLDRNAPGRTVRLASSFQPRPQLYGIQAVEANMRELEGTPIPGMYAVSTHLVARVPSQPQASDWLRRTPPVAVVGHSFYIYEIPPPAGGK